MKRAELMAMTLKQLVALQIDLTEVIEQKRTQEHAVLREKLAKMAQDAGFRLENVLNITDSGKRTRKLPAAPIKFRDPANPSNVWSGRGRPARWLAAYLKQGKKLDAFRVA